MNEPTTSNSTEQLPAFLRRRNGNLELVLHCTWIQDYFVCPRKFWLRYDARVEATGPRAALNYGSAVHAGLAVINQGGTLDVALAAIDAYFEANPQPEDDYRSPGRCKDLIRAYVEEERKQAEVESYVPWQVLAVEESFEVYVGNVDLLEPYQRLVGYEHSLRTSVPCFLAGRKDLVVAWHGGIWVVDHKTTQDWGGGENAHLLEGRRSFQFKGYAWAEREAHRGAGYIAHRMGEESNIRNQLPVLGTIGNYLVSRKPLAEGAKPRANTLPRNEFHRECYPFEPAVLDEWREEFMDVAECIMRDWTRKRWAAHDTGCGHWGRCEFYDYCEESPERRGDLLNSSMFREKDFSHIGTGEE